MRYRLVYAGLALVGLAAIAFGVVFSKSGEPVELPGPLEAVFPLPGDLVIQQTFIEIDLEVGYQAEIFVDGWQISDANFAEGTGVYRWSPNPNHPAITEWSPGEHTISITWDRVAGLPDPGSYEWSFRVS